VEVDKLASEKRSGSFSIRISWLEGKWDYRQKFFQKLQQKRPLVYERTEGIHQALPLELKKGVNESGTDGNE